ncbi:MAG: hypothetical protein N2652_02730 [Kiritimatiellae bacterium]|nr:hypothetical protein [Kiritimatiellia bacterium]
MSTRGLTRREFLAAAAVGAAGPEGDRGEHAARSESRISYYCDGELRIGVPGRSAERVVTSGHWDFKPSWSPTGGLLVGFRRLRDDRVVANWKTAILVVKVDGTGLHFLSDGTHTDFNPTWTRDGTSTPVWNRKNEATGGYIVMRSRVGGRAGEEQAITDRRVTTWVHSALRDGRLLVAATPPRLGRGY